MLSLYEKKRNDMNQQAYLKKKLSELGLKPKVYQYWCWYQWITIKNLFVQTTIIFIFQYLTTVNLPFSYPGLAMYPPMGIAFVMFYLLGKNAFPGIILGGFCGYLLKGMPIVSTLLYLTADIGCGYLGARLCQNTFSTDIRILLNLREGIQFFKTNALITCSFSGFIRTFSFILNYKESQDIGSVFFTYINLWLADLNAILILSGFLLSWVYVPFSRERISKKTIHKIEIFSWVTWVVLLMLFMKSDWMIYWMITGMLLSLYWSQTYGNLVATALLFIMANLYLAYFMGFQYRHFLYLDIQFYIFVPIILLLWVLCILYIGHCTLEAENGRKRAFPLLNP